MIQPVRTALFGFGKMGHGYADDPMMARHFPYAAHAQVLADHPGISWDAVVDPADSARQAARERWQVPVCVGDPDGMGQLAEEIELAVLATTPDVRLGLLDRLPALRAVLVEKPLGADLAGAQQFIDVCATRGIMVQVNVWRRADKAFRQLANGQMAELIGTPQAATCLYGNGLLNNGTHMIDFARMLFGEVAGIQLLGRDAGFEEGPIPGDRNPRFAVEFQSGLILDYQPLKFSHYRENGLIVWGDKGRLDILSEGLTIAHYPLAANRAMSGEHEIAVDRPTLLEPGAGTALYDMYDNMLEALHAADPARLVSQGASAMVTHGIVDAVRRLTPTCPTVRPYSTVRLAD